MLESRVCKGSSPIWGVIGVSKSATKATTYRFGKHFSRKDYSLHDNYPDLKTVCNVTAFTSSTPPSSDIHISFRTSQSPSTTTLCSSIHSSVKKKTHTAVPSSSMHHLPPLDASTLPAQQCLKRVQAKLHP